MESHLHKYLIEHLNAEIFLGTIHDVTVATDWIRSTFLYVRACKSPQNYGMMKTHDVREIERRLQGWLMELTIRSYVKNTRVIFTLFYFTFYYHLKFFNLTDLHVRLCIYIKQIQNI